MKNTDEYTGPERRSDPLRLLPTYAESLGYITRMLREKTTIDNGVGFPQENGVSIRTLAKLRILEVLGEAEAYKRALSLPPDFLHVDTTKLYEKFGIDPDYKDPYDSLMCRGLLETPSSAAVDLIGHLELVDPRNILKDFKLYKLNPIKLGRNPDRIFIIRKLAVKKLISLLEPNPEAYKPRN
ncbi:MAG: hypothetical protein US89_C0006G0058 [Candidatus Peregrinibacteria bacterium GW2011_GWF2_38_29]|nr:MAG: hypothetical protein US89_C0006G0058 [Candidatus Peregrinibacteria bacterium GW2011_GWF2_38_29]HBB03249.1 hypothetical protein [Candidatus Peregrinibacteria bacterium]